MKMKWSFFRKSRGNDIPLWPVLCYTKTYHQDDEIKLGGILIALHWLTFELVGFTVMWVCLAENETGK